MIINTQLYDMARLREQEYLDAACRRGRNRGSGRLVTTVTRRLRRRG